MKTGSLINMQERESTNEASSFGYKCIVYIAFYFYYDIEIIEIYLRSVRY